MLNRVARSRILVGKLGRLSRAASQVSPSTSSSIPSTSSEETVILPPRSSLPATFLEIKHGQPAALLHLRSYHPSLLNLFIHFAAHSAEALGIPLSRPVSLPTQRSLWTVPRSPFVHKKSQENFERKTHKRLLKAWDTNPGVIDKWMRYLQRHSLAGVGMRVVKWERVPLGIGRTTLDDVMKGRGGEDGKALKALTPRERMMALSAKIVAEESKTTGKPTTSGARGQAKGGRQKPRSQQKGHGAQIAEQRPLVDFVTQSEPVLSSLVRSATEEQMKPSPKRPEFSVYGQILDQLAGDDIPPTPSASDLPPLLEASADATTKTATQPVDIESLPGRSVGVEDSPVVSEFDDSTSSIPFSDDVTTSSQASLTPMTAASIQEDVRNDSHTSASSVEAPKENENPALSHAAPSDSEAAAFSSTRQTSSSSTEDVAESTKDTSQSDIASAAWELLVRPTSKPRDGGDKKP